MVRIGGTTPVSLAVIMSLATGAVAAPAARAASVPARTPVAPRASADPTNAIRFEVNNGQTDRSVRFVVRGAGSQAFLTATDAVFLLTAPSTAKAKPAAPAGRRDQKPIESDVVGAVVRMHMVGANPNPVVSGEGLLPGVTNYLIGREPSSWHTGISSYSRVRYHALYPGIDLVYHAGSNGGLEYDYEVTPGASTDAVDAEFQGADSVASGPGGLSVGTAAGPLTERPPTIFQDVNGKRVPVTGGYSVKGDHHVGFSIGAHDTTRPLVIDPLLAYSTYLGGSTGYGNTGQGVAADSTGTAYITGAALAVADFPTTTGAYQPGFNGTSTPPTYNVFVSKLTPDGSGLVYSTYLGGSGGGSFFSGDFGSGIALGPSGQAYITGWTTSANYPTTISGYQTSLQGTLPNRNGFLTVLNAQGSGLVYSSYLGGDGGAGHGGDQANAIAVDAAGYAYLAGSTASTNFPATADAFQSRATCAHNCTTYHDGVSSAASATYTSATADFNTYDVGAPITGSTLASNTTIQSVQTPSSVTLSQPATGSGTGQAFTIGGGYRGPNIAFLAKLDPTKSGASSLTYSTLIGGSLNGNGAQGISLDGSGAIYLTGYTASGDYPTTPGAYQTVCHICNNFTDGAIAGAGRTTLQSPTAAFNADDVGLGLHGPQIAVGTHVASVESPTSLTLDTPGLAGGTTAFTLTARNHAGESVITKLAPALGAAPLVYSTFFGHSAGDQGDDVTAGIAVDSANQAYVAGDTSSVNFPTTPGAFDVQCHQTTSSPCGTHPAFTDGVTTGGSTTFRSTSAHFNSDTDNGRAIAGTNIPAGANIDHVVDVTTVVLDQAAMASGSGLSFSLTRDTGKEGFVSKLNALGSGLVYSTYLGGTSDGHIYGIAVDGSGRAVVAGRSGAGTTYPLRDQVVGYGGGVDGVATELNSAGNGLVYSTFLGGSLADSGNAVALDPSGTTYVTGNSTSADFPTTPGAVQRNYGSGIRFGNAFITKLSPVAASVPIVSSISPTHGSLTSGPPIVITGHGFTGATAVSFGGVASSGFAVNSDTQITAVSPPQPPPPLGTTLVQGVTVTTAGGTSPDNPIDRFTYGEGQWAATGSLGVTRAGASGTLLSNGKVLVAGGGDFRTSAAYTSAELYDPGAGTWTPTGSLTDARMGHTATLFPSGKVLVTGGQQLGGGIASAELYDPAATGCGTGITGCWTTVAPLPAPRTGHTATLLPSGKVLVAGGQTSNGATQVNTAYLYDPTANTWTGAGTMTSNHSAHTATLLRTGKVLVVAGCCADPAGSQVSPIAELYDPAGLGCGTGVTGCWTVTGTLSQARTGHTATLLADGRVVVAGGGTFGSTSAISSVELYDPAQGSWSLVGLMQHPRAGHTATLLPGGKVLFAGGTSGLFVTGPLQSAELLDPAQPSGTAAADLMITRRAELNGTVPGQPTFSATLLPSGRVLTAGGSGDTTAELYSPAVPTLAAVVGGNNALFAKQTGQPFQSLGGGLLAAPAVVSVPAIGGGSPPVPIYIGLGGDHHLYVRGTSAVWQALITAPHGCFDSPGAAVTGPTGGPYVLTVACEGGDQGLYFWTMPITSSALPSSDNASLVGLGGLMIAGPTVAPVNGTITFYVVGTDRRVYSRTAAPAPGYVGLPAGCIGHVAVATLGTVSYMACHGLDGAAYYSMNTGSGFGTFRSAGGLLIDGVGLAMTPSEEDIYVEGVDHRLYHTVISPAGTAAGVFLADGGLIQYGAAAIALN